MEKLGKFGQSTGPFLYKYISLLLFDTTLTELNFFFIRVTSLLVVAEITDFVIICSMRKFTRAERQKFLTARYPVTVF